MRIKFLMLLLLSVSVSGCLKTRGQIGGSEASRVSVEQQAQVKSANAEIQLQELQSELRRMNGQIETLEYRISNQQKENSENKKSAPADELIEQMRLFESTLKSLEMRIQKLENSRGTSAAPGKSASQKEDQLFAAAESNFQKKDWQKAILNYEKYRTNYPKGKHWSNSTYKIGVCFQELNLIAEAKSFFEEVLLKAPKTAAARKAKYRLNQLKKAS